MNLFLKLLSLINFAFFITMLANFTFGLINPEWIFVWKLPPESTLELIFMSFMIFMWGEVFFLVVFRLAAPYALDYADKLLNEGNRDRAMELYFTIVKRFIWPRGYRSRIPEMMELVIEWLIEKKDDRNALKIAE